MNATDAARLITKTLDTNAELVAHLRAYYDRLPDQYRASLATLEEGTKALAYLYAESLKMDVASALAHERTAVANAAKELAGLERLRAKVKTRFWGNTMPADASLWIDGEITAAQTEQRAASLRVTALLNYLGKED